MQTALSLNTLVQIPDMSIGEIEHAVFNLEMCIDSLNRNIREGNLDAGLREQCMEVKGNLESSVTKLRASLVVIDLPSTINAVH